MQAPFLNKYSDFLFFYLKICFFSFINRIFIHFICSGILSFRRRIYWGRKESERMITMTTLFAPEGQRLHAEENRRAQRSPAALREACGTGQILEARAILCDSEHNLHVDLPCMAGVIPREEGALSLGDGGVRDIALISRVSKPVCFTVTGFRTLPGGEKQAILSRRDAQRRCREQYLQKLRPGDILPARVTRLEPFGAFCDIGCGIAALLPIANISVSRIPHPSERFSVGTDLFCAVSSFDGDRLCLTQKELLGTWEQNAALFYQGETVAGIVRSVEEYGIFVELTPNLAGLAEPHPGVRPGMQAGVYIKSILPDRMKIKLVLIDAQDAACSPPPLRYFQTEGHISRFLYSPACCARRIETVFDVDPPA